jgi:gluconate 5-dehydrogenase
MCAVDALFDVAGRVALVTGSSRGIGRALAGGLAAAGAAVVLNGRDPDAVETGAPPEFDAWIRARTPACSPCCS